MSQWFDKNWINRISISLEGFVWRSDNTANFRCPICGDSDTNSSKRRGYFYVHSNKWAMKCHNCGQSYLLPTFIKVAFPHLYSEYKLEKLKETREILPPTVKKQPTVEPKKVPVAEGHYTLLSDLPETHEAVQYCLNRKIPKSAFGRICWTENFAELVHVGYGITDKYKKEGRSILPSRPRLFFQIKDRDGKVVGVQGRSIVEKSFLTLMFEEGFPKVFGLDQISSNQLVFEAAFCSLFVPGSIAALGASVADTLLDITPDANMTFVFDNEPRSKDTVSRMAKAINQGFRVAFWPDSFYHKDLNDYMKDDPQPDLDWIISELKKNSFSGIKANLHLTTWSKTRSIKC